MRLILLGPPGAGKGTQAKNIVKTFNIPHISTGDIFRKNIAEKTHIGLKAKEYIDNGQLVPDDITIEICLERLNQQDCMNGFLLDGFPRTVRQADALEEFLKSRGLKLDAAINIIVPTDVLKRRLSGRRVCLNCGASFNVETNPPKVEGICDYCSSKLIQRDDDSIETVNERLEVYRRQTEPIVDYYGKKGLLRNIDGYQDIAKVFEDICIALGREPK
ncbi:adenylate kinase [Caloramator australicus]|uniref:Adenylate kinase n=1 Tax=Caloramator australicus RC3 TaxID=857293 RepID=I7LGH7_9CLOT|nr:adenylate kinase [Caloramator australicus]CCJ33290.1 Adenylate kinase [Caloramator australicus RC3]